MIDVAYIGAGSNLAGPLGDRRAYLAAARAALHDPPRVEVTRVSSTIETPAVGGPPGQGPFLNEVWEVRTDVSPRDLLDRLMTVERSLGRVRRERWGPRTIDLDLLFHGGAVLDESGLTVPHPEAHRRDFVLRPMTELAPMYVHPRLGRTMRELFVSDLR